MRNQQTDIIEDLAAADHEEAKALIDLCMRPDETLSMAEDFPLLVGPEAKSLRLVCKEGGRILAHVAARELALDTPDGGVLALWNIGAVVTAEAARGRGLASALIEECLRRGKEQGAAAAVLWTDRPDFYARLGFSPAGRELAVHVPRERLVNVAPVPIRPLHPAELEEILALREKDPFCARRPLEDWRRLHGLPRSRCFVAPAMGPVLAALVFGKGCDFEGMITEWVGDVSLLPRMLRTLLDTLRLEETTIFGPAKRRDFRETFERLQCRRLEQPLALFAPLADAAFLQNPLLDRLYLRGLDSM